jgi:hypothetical protein
MEVALVLADADLPSPMTSDSSCARYARRAQSLQQDISDTAWLTPWAAELRYDIAARWPRRSLHRRRRATPSCYGYQQGVRGRGRMPRPLRLLLHVSQVALLARNYSDAGTQRRQ